MTYDTDGSFGSEPRVLAALLAWMAWAAAVLVGLGVLGDPAVAQDFETGSHTRSTGGALLAIPLLYLAALVLGCVSVTKPSTGRTISFVVLLCVGALRATDPVRHGPGLTPPRRPRRASHTLVAVTMRVLLCSDRWGPLPATDVTSAIAAGWHDRQPGAEVLPLPFSSGGTGFVDCLAASLPATPDEVWRLRADTTDYLDGGLLTPDGDSGPLGSAIATSIDDGARRIVIGIGEADGVDGGAGLIHSLGGSADLREALPRAAERTRGVRLVAAYRGDTPLLGLKGASASAVGTLGWTRQQAQDHERRIGEFADNVRRILPPRTDLLSGRTPRLDLEPGSGAGGGAGFALAAIGARLLPGADVFADAVGLRDRVAGADLVVVGTQVFDWRSLGYDTVATVVEAAVDDATPAILLAHEVEVGRRETMSLGASAAYGIVDPRSLRSREDTDLLTGLTALARRVAGTWSAV